MDYITQLMENTALWVAILSWTVAQLIKVIIDLIRNKKFDYHRFIGSGGMPSSHTSFVVALSVSVGKQVGFDSPIFASCAVISFVVMYDAAGVRRAAGKHAAIINNLIEILEDKGMQMDRKLKELLGHSPIEVFAGALLGIIIAVIV